MIALAEHLLIENAGEEQAEKEHARRELYAPPEGHATPRAPRSGRQRSSRPPAMTRAQAMALVGQAAKEDAVGTR